MDDVRAKHIRIRNSIFNAYSPYKVSFDWAITKQAPTKHISRKYHDKVALMSSKPLFATCDKLSAWTSSRRVSS